jgi:hypothetical protein
MSLSTLTNNQTGNFISVISYGSSLVYTEFLQGDAIISIHLFTDGGGSIFTSEFGSEGCFFEKIECGDFPCLDDLLSSDEVVKIITNFRCIDWKPPQTFGL